MLLISPKTGGLLSPKFCLVNILFLVFVSNSHGSVLTKTSISKEELQRAFNTLPNNSPHDVELAHVTFKTELRHKRDVFERDFHIIEIHRENYSTLSVHLSRKTTLVSPDFKVMIKNGDEESYQLQEMETDCIYDGHIPSDPEHGSAAFSSCGVHFGFSGMVIYKGQQFHIEPHPEASHTKHAKGFVPHIIRVPKESNTHHIHYPRYHSQIYHMPRTPIREKREAGEEENLIDDSEQNIMIQADDSISGSSKFQTLRGKKGKTSTTETKGKNSGNQYLVEIAVFADPDFYNALKARYPQDTMNKIKDYVLTAINGMDLTYQQPSLGLNLHFSLVHLEIMTSWPSGIKTHNGVGGDYLRSFCSYSASLNSGNSLWDHGLMLTGIDIKIDHSNPGLVGIAAFEAMCYLYSSCSLIEGTDFGVVSTTSHEIGHSLGMDHDGESVNKNCDKNKYIMSPTTGAGKCTWSSCSAHSLKEFVTKGTAAPKGGRKYYPPACLWTQHGKTKPINYQSKTLPGVKYDADAQCKAHDPKTSPMINSQKPFNDPCGLLYCGNGRSGRGTSPALDGTTCETGKWCIHGKCVKK